MNTKFLIKFSQELTTKSRPVRKNNIKLLNDNIYKTLVFNQIDAKTFQNWDYIIVELFDEAKKDLTIEILQKIFWISSFYQIIEFNFEKFEEIISWVWKYFEWQFDNKNFFVKVKRTGKHDFSSQEAQKLIWSYILKNSKNAKVSLEKADIILKLEIKDQKVFLQINKFSWAKWYPIWFSGKVLSLISGWFDSPVASYMSLKRWLELDYLFFDFGFKPHEIAVRQISYYLWKNYSPFTKSVFVKVDFQFLINLLVKHCNPKFRSVLLKRYMLKTTDLLNEYLLENFKYFTDPFKALVKWDSLAQVSSQTLQNLTTIDTATKNLVLRPLVMFDKQDIIDISKEIWTYDFSLSMPEYCSVVSQAPSTKSTFEDIKDFEEIIDKEFFAEIYKNISVFKMSEILNFQKQNYNIQISNHIWENDILIDIRELENILKKPLKIDNITKIEIPFFDINSKFEKLDQSKKYLLYCDKWVLSSLHYLYLKEKWFENIWIYRPE